MKISKRNIDKLLPKSVRYCVWDEDLTGFGVRVGVTGKKVFICRYRGKGQRRQYKLGKYGAITPEEARKRAKEILGMVALGSDPAAEREEERRALSVNELYRLYVEGHGPKLKPSTLADYKRGMRLHVLPSIGKLPAESVTLREINKIHVKLVEYPYRANRVISYISAMYGWAALNGYVPENMQPTRRIKRFRENFRQRYLSDEELVRLGQTLELAETKGLPWCIAAGPKTAKHVPKKNQTIIYPRHVTDAIRLLLMTGCRKGEILNLEWSQVDLGRGFLFLPDSKTGQKTVILNRSAIAILSNMERSGRFVIPGDIPDQPRHDLKRPWDHIRTAAQIEDVRLHDLRHTHASIGAAAGFGLPIVGRLLGHTNAATTQRYAHIADNPARVASDAIGLILEKAMGTPPARGTDQYAEWRNGN